MRIGLVREEKQPADKRVALTPELGKKFKELFPEIELVVEESEERCFTSKDYQNAGVKVVKDLRNCDVILGVKEVPISKLITGKKYLFFSHTIKAQDYNRALLQAILEKEITLIDYETLTWQNGKRILGFGKWAGIVGTYNTFLTWGKKTGSFNLLPAYECRDYDHLLEELGKVDLGAIKIVYTGNGRVAGGIREVLEHMNLKEVGHQDIISETYNEPVFRQLTNWDLYHRKDGGQWSDEHFYNNHQDYCCEFEVFASEVDILINGMYWEDDMEPLFTKKATESKAFKISVIADITCDVEGSVPITMEATDIYNPTFGWSRSQQKQVAAFGEDTIDVMAVTNLPTELPKNASFEFGSSLLEHIIPLLINGDKDDIIKGATITENGSLTNHYNYLTSFVNEEVS